MTLGVVTQPLTMPDLRCFAAVELTDSPHTVGEHPLIKGLVKATFQSRPSLPRYQSTWDVSTVLSLLMT